MNSETKKIIFFKVAYYFGKLGSTDKNFHSSFLACTCIHPKNYILRQKNFIFFHFFQKKGMQIVCIPCVGTTYVESIFLLKRDRADNDISGVTCHATSPIWREQMKKSKRLVGRPRTGAKSLTINQTGCNPGGFRPHLHPQKKIEYRE